MKRCEDCGHFHGFDYSDGTPECDVAGGYENCPYAETGTVSTDGNKSALGVKIELGDIEARIMYAMENSIESVIYGYVESVVRAKYEDTIKSVTERAIKERLEKQVESYMESTIKIGGGWREPERTLTRAEYLSETVAKQLDEKYDVQRFVEAVKKEAARQIDGRTETLRREINTAIRQMFDDATRQTLTDNVVNLLMANQTYRKLSDSMGHMLKG